MDRKKFVTLFSTSIIGTALLKANPLKYLMLKNSSEASNSVKVKINPYAVNREKSGKNNG